MQVMMRTAGGNAVSGYTGGGRSPIGIGGAIAVHAVVVGAYLLMPKEMIAPYIPTILVGTPIAIEPPPPPNDPPQTQADPLIRTMSKAREPIIPDPFVLPPPSDGLKGAGSSGSDSGLGGGSGDGTVITPPIDPPAPIFVDAAIDPRALAGFQPDYPGAMIRQGMEGTVRVRVTISAEGRVTEIENLSATDAAFWLATRRHALRQWRFRPATRDGVAVGSSKILTVRFNLEGR